MLGGVQQATKRQLVGLSLVTGIAVLTAFTGKSALIQVSALFPAVLPENPYFVPGHALLLYPVTAVVVVACVAMLLAPGMLAVFAAGGEGRAGTFLLKSFGAAYALRVLAHTLVLRAGVESQTFAWFVAVEMALDVPLAVAAIRRAARGGVAWPFAAAEDRRRVALAFAIPAVLVAALLPLFFWQSLTSDGVEAVEIGYSLKFHARPHFPNSSGLGSIAAGMIAMAPPIHWFIQLIGPVEAAARLPFALYLPILYAALTELMEWKAARRLRLAEEGVLLLALASYAVAMSFNSTYDPYSADIASPGAAFETLTVLCFAATVLFVWQNKVRWLMLFAALGILARPIELVLLFGLALGVALAGGTERRELLRRIAFAIATCIVIVLLHDALWIRIATGGDSVSLGQLHRWRFLTLTDASRLLYAAIPAGLLPFLSLTLWSRQDRESRQVTVACVFYLALFYVQSFLAMHHFVPVMVLPLVVLWRTHINAALPRLVPVAAVVAAACLWLSLPQRFEVDRTARNVGCRTAYLATTYMKDWPSHRTTVRARGTLGALFNTDRGRHPDRDLLMFAGPLQYYAWRCATDPSAAQYVVQSATAVPPNGGTAVLRDTLVALYVRDTVAWREERRRPPPIDWRSRIYSTPFATLHRPVGAPQGNYEIDLTTVPIIWRLFRAGNRRAVRDSLGNTPAPSNGSRD